MNEAEEPLYVGFEPRPTRFTDIFKDVDGGWSSKRVAGFLVLVNLIAMCWWVAVRVPSSTEAALLYLATLAGGLFGLGVLERWDPARKAQQSALRPGGPLPSGHGSARDYR